MSTQECSFLPLRIQEGSSLRISVASVASVDFANGTSWQVILPKEKIKKHRGVGRAGSHTDMMNSSS